MAIKGKRRSRGSRVHVAAPPRPVMVTPRKPLLRRLWFRALILAVVVGAVATGGFFAWQEQRAAAELEATREDVARLGVAMEAALVGLGTPAGSDFLLLPDVGQTMADISSGEHRERRVRRDLDRWQEMLDDADDRLSAIQTERAQARQALARMREGLGLYGGVLSGVRDLLEVEDEQERQEGLIQISGRYQEAAETFSSGWLIYVTLRAEVGLDAVTPEMDPSQLPPGIDPSQLPPGIDPSQLPPGIDPGQLPPQFDPTQVRPEGEEELPAEDE